MSCIDPSIQAWTLPSVAGDGVGAHAGFVGKLDEVRVWGVTLREGQLREFALLSGNAVRTAHPFASLLAAYYRFNEGNGTVVHDWSAHRRDLTLFKDYAVIRANRMPSMRRHPEKVVEAGRQRREEAAADSMYGLSGLGGDVFYGVAFLSGLGTAGVGGGGGSGGGGGGGVGSGGSGGGSDDGIDMRRRRQLLSSATTTAGDEFYGLDNSHGLDNTHGPDNSSGLDSLYGLGNFYGFYGLNQGPLTTGLDALQGLGDFPLPAPEAAEEAEEEEVVNNPVLSRQGLTDLHKFSAQLKLL